MKHLNIKTGIYWLLAENIEKALQDWEIGKNIWKDYNSLGNKSQRWQNGSNKLQSIYIQVYMQYV